MSKRRAFDKQSTINQIGDENLAYKNHKVK